MTANAADFEQVGALLGRIPQGDFSVVVRRRGGEPVVIENAPFLKDGTPMPTRYWLVDPQLRAAVSTLEAEGGVKGANRDVDADDLEEAHERYRRQRDALIPATWNGPRPSGGVGGARQGVKCLHAHLAWWLTGADDPVGQWVAARLAVVAEFDRGERPS